MKYTIVRVDGDTYPLFDEMIFLRGNGRDRTQEERAEPRDFAANLRSCIHSVERRLSG